MNQLQFLVIDDDIEFTELIRIKLESWGHAVTVANNWLTAIFKADRIRFDCMLVDVDMPTGNGLTACRDLSTDPQFCAIKKVFITGKSDLETKQRCHDLNAAYVHKSKDLFLNLRTAIDSIGEMTPVLTDG
tara:strand:- start:1108138 stop:1108530 length:393 start_codon:yes stop_codon:yes gene_type:complete